MITPETIETVIDFVKEKPRTVQEVAHLLKINWRTADKYVKWIEEHQGIISSRTFRGGTRGALKIVFYRFGGGGEPIRTKLYEMIMNGVTKDDFDFFDVYELVDKKNRKVFVDRSKYPSVSKKQEFFDFVSSAKENLYVFSGNVSWVNLVEEKGKRRMYDIIEQLLARGVSIKVLARVDVTSIGNIEKLMAIDRGRGLIQVRHYTQPVRGFINDDKSMRFKSVFASAVSGASGGTDEVKSTFAVFYQVNDNEWVEWMTGIFWKMFSTAVPYEKRLDALGDVKRLL